MKYFTKSIAGSLRLLADPAEGKCFETIYLDVRASEQRIYSIDTVKKLPDVSVDHPHYQEWSIRKRSMLRFLKYIKAAQNVERILEVGCGNGWFSAAISREFPDKQVVGCDLNLFELKQAKSAFDQANLSFVYADIFEEWPSDLQNFDLIFLASSAQYFKNLNSLMLALKLHTSKRAEIHFLDTHFYPQKKIKAAESRSHHYYVQLGYSAMAENYFHHSMEDLKRQGARLLYKPRGMLRWFSPNASPFPWAKIMVSKP